MDSMLAYPDLPARGAADGCESYKTTEEMDLSFACANHYIEITQYEPVLPNALHAESKMRRKEISWNLEWFTMKRASLKRKEGLLFEKHRQIKKKLHDFLNFATKKETELGQTTANYKSQPRSYIEQSSLDTGLVTVLKNGKKCTYC